MTNIRKLEEIEKTLTAAAMRRSFRRADFFEPYPKQQDFFDLSFDKRERLLMAGNQLGKTFAGAYEIYCHMTGEYPDWWLGRKFTKPVRAWACGESSLLVRDVQQKLLCGEPGVLDAFGTGMIPKESFIDKPSMARGVTDAYDTIQVKHKTNGIPDGTSVLRFKSYEQGRLKFQGETLDVIWDDEEPPMDIYSEQLTRITATNGMIFTTFTPLKGMSTVVARFLQEPSRDRAVTTMTIDDVTHISEDEKKKIIAGYPAHEREARARGVPMLGSGRIFMVSEESIMTPMLENIPSYWCKLWGVDFGIGHPFAAVLGVWDKDNDVIYVVHAIRIKDQGPLQHSVPMKIAGRAVPVAWPQDGHQRDKGSGEAIAAQYKAQGLAMLPEHAMFPDGSNSTEAGLLEMDERMKTGRLKVCNHLTEWFEEFRLYHRKDGQIVKERDDLMSATRIMVMAKRFARAVPLGSHEIRRRGTGVARDVDFDVFGV